MPTRTLDCFYLDQPEFAAAYLLRGGAEAAFVDNNTTLAVPRLLAALAAEGLEPADVRWIIVTHVHLDHAGGTAALAAACPSATVLCHPRAERHLLDPSRLVASARVVYGDATFDRLYGTIDAIAASRVRVVADGERVPLGSRDLEFLHTRGHANHHMCILDAHRGDVLTGDAFGLCYPTLQRGRRFLFPSTSPTEFDAPEARAAVRRIVATGADRALLTHFGPITDLAAGAEDLLEWIDASEAVLEAAVVCDLPNGALEAFCFERIDALFDRKLAAAGLQLDARERDLLRHDRELNAAGLAFVAAKRRG